MIRTNIISFLLLVAVVRIDAIYNDIPSIDPFEVVSLATVLKKYESEITNQPFMPACSVSYEPLPFIPDEFKSFQPHDITFDATWVLTIPHGRVCTDWGYVLIDGKYMLRELMWPCLRFFHSLNLLNHLKYTFDHVRKVSGRVAVITCPGTTNYAHFLMETLGRLAMLEIMGIEYDWIYLNYDGLNHFKPYKEQILRAWGIDFSKIIEPFGEFTCIEADELIVPSRTFYLTSAPGKMLKSHYTPLCGVYSPAWLAEYYRSKFLPMVHKKTDGHSVPRKKIFISRCDSSLRFMNNESEVFSLFEPYGFEKYVLSTLTFLEQVELFANAEIVVGANGAGLYNMLFCQPGTKIVEIFQERVDSTFSFLAQTVGLEYVPVKTTDFPIYDPEGGNPTVVDLSIIQDLINSLGLN